MSTMGGAGMTRKDFMTLVGGGVLAVSAIPAVGGLQYAAAADGTLRISFRSSIKRLDPAFAISGDEYVVTQAIYDNLTRLDPSFSVQPALAERWNSDDGAVTWTFHLREGVRFHHGRALDAEDVVFSIRRVLAEGTGSPGRRAIGPIADVSAVDSRTVRFALQGPFADFPAIMSQTFARIVPRDAAGNLDQQPVGTGPFRFAEWMTGQHVKLTRNPDYWEPGLPRVNEVWMVTYPALAAEQAALISGETEIMWEVPTSVAPTIEALPNVKLTEIPSMGFQPVVMRSDRPPFNDVRVRQAFKHAINREQIMRFVLQGRGTVAYDTPVPPASRFHVDVAALPYDPGKAKQLLVEAGYGDGFSLQLFASHERAGCIETAQVIKPMLEAIGVRVDIQQRSWDRFLSEVWSKETFFVSSWLGRPTIDEQLYPYYHSSGSWNEYHYSNPEIDKLLDDARRETDEQARHALYRRVQEILAVDGPAIIPYFSNYATAMVEAVSEVPVHPLKWVDLRRAELGA